MFYLLNSNILMLLYTGFIFLIIAGLIGLLNDGDIFIGFLWVIDLGVGLVFLIFVLHFSTFLSQKSIVNLSLRNRLFFTVLIVFTLIFYYLFPNPTPNSLNNFNTTHTWFFKITFVDYYAIYNSFQITDLQVIKDAYFNFNSFEFFVINFSLLFGLLTAVLLFFLIKRIFIFLNYNYLINNKLINKVNTNFFIRNQDFIRQQNTSMTTRIWSKKRKN